jgi:hypothetical protein
MPLMSWVKYTSPQYFGFDEETLEKTIIPLFVNISTKIKLSAQLLSLVSSISYVHTCINNKQKEGDH